MDLLLLEHGLFGLLVGLVVQDDQVPARARGREVRASLDWFDDESLAGLRLEKVRLNKGAAAAGLLEASGFASGAPIQNVKAGKVVARILGVVNILVNDKCCATRFFCISPEKYDQVINRVMINR